MNPLMHISCAGVSCMEASCADAIANGEAAGIAACSTWTTERNPCLSQVSRLSRDSSAHEWHILERENSFSKVKFLDWWNRTQIQGRRELRRSCANQAQVHAQSSRVKGSSTHSEPSSDSLRCACGTSRRTLVESNAGVREENLTRSC